MPREPAEGEALTSESSESLDTLSMLETLRLPEGLPVEQGVQTAKGRYEIVAFLGKGGMGQVYKAYEPMLKRYVALKFLHGDAPAQIERFLQEARAQARVEHEHVCKVYEVGETVEGKPYIAMQYIEGRTLGVAVQEMTLEQKVKVMKEVAEAVHAAHRTGLIHRDLKPSNIMVERTEDGEWKPYVMDFGLAREQGAMGLTMTGMTLGTPAYMAPEQVRGDVHRLDRRTDVYSLGATLYELLSGHFPFEGTTAMDMLMKVMHEESVPLRKVDPGIPGDLETIVIKCLEKEPQRRYESAKALAEDLGRYLDGEPIQAWRASWTYRIEKRIRKNKALAGVVAVAAVLVLVLGGMGLKAQWQAKERAAMAQRFAQDVKEIEGIMRFASLLPLHDTRRETALIRERMKRIEAEMKRLGRVGEAPGHYALGRGYLTLHAYETAREHLEAAWQREYRAPEVGYALGQVMGALYQKALEEAQRIGNKELREARKKKIEKAYREPALHYLKASSGAPVDAPAYVEGLIALYEKQHEEALKKARQAFEQVPWLYEAKKLEGDIYLEVGRSKQDTGNYAGAMEDYERAGEAYRAAREMARSDAILYEAEAERWLGVIKAEVSQGVSPERSLDGVVDACDKSINVNPERGDGYRKKSLAYVWLGYYQIYHTGQDPRGVLEKAIGMAQEAVKKNPKDADAYTYMGSAYGRVAEYELEHGNDPRNALTQAIEQSRKALENNPNNAYAYYNLGLTYALLGEYQIGHGEDPGETLGQALAQYQKDLQLEPTDSYAYANLGDVYRLMGEYAQQQGRDPGDALSRARTALQRAIQFNPNSPETYLKRSVVELVAARWAIHRGQSPAPFFDKARGALQQVLRLNPQSADAYRAMAELHRWQAERRLMRKERRQNDIGQGLAMVEKALALNPQIAEAVAIQGALYLLQARAERNLAARMGSARHAQSSLTKALRMNPLLRREYEPLLHQAKSLIAQTAPSPLQRQ